MDTISLLFDLHSNILASSTQKLKIPVKKFKFTAFEAFLKQNEGSISIAQVEELDVKSTNLDSQGTVTIKFNKKIIVPRIEIATEIPESEEFESGIKIPTIKIEDFLQLEVDYDDYYAHLNKQISKYTAISVDDQTLIFNVEFSKPSDISTDIKDLDDLIIKFLIPE